MRRQYQPQATGNTLLAWLQAHDCLLYSPLSQTDTSDWISGNAIEPYASGSMEWDSTSGMWKFQRVSGQPYNNSQYAAKWELASPLTASMPLTFTAIAELYCHRSDGVQNCYDVLPTRQGWALYGYKDQTTQSVQTFNSSGNSVQYQYRNGTQVFTYTYSSSLKFTASTHIRIATFHSSSTTAALGPYGLRNFAFFNRVLTTSEINEYFTLI